MKCAICSKPESEIQLFEGISIGEMVMVCRPCAEEQKIPILSKPSVQQLEKADEYHSVRQRMERISGMRRVTHLTDDSASGQTLRARLKSPPQAQAHDGVVHNYHWNITLARRRKKLTVSQVAKALGIKVQTLQSIERGKIPKDFEDVFPLLEDYFSIQLLTKRPAKISYVRRDPDYEKEILATVKEKMGNPGYEGEAVDEVDDGADDPTPRDVTLNQLIERKRARDKKKRQKKEREVEDAMIGDDLELDIDEV